MQEPARKRSEVWIAIAWAIYAGVVLSAFFVGTSWQRHGDEEIDEAAKRDLYRQCWQLREDMELHAAQIDQLQDAVADLRGQIEQFLETITAAPPGGSPLDQYATPVPGKPGWMRVNINDLPEHMRPVLTDQMKAAAMAHAEKETKESK